MPDYKILDTEDRWDTTTEDEWLFWPRVLWIDPGTVSGVAVVWFDPWALFENKTTAKTILAYSEIFLDGPEDGPNGQVNRFLRMQRTLNQEPGLATGIESFVVRSANMDWEFLSPVRLRAAISNRLSMLPPNPHDLDEMGRVRFNGGTPLHAQSPSDAKNAFTNDRLKALRMYRPGPDHVNDAKKHALLWIRKIGKAGPEAFRAAHGDDEGWWQ